MENEEASLIDCSPEVTKKKWGRAGPMWGSLKVDWSAARSGGARWQGLEARGLEIEQSLREKQGREVNNNKNVKHMNLTKFFVKQNVQRDKLTTASSAPRKLKNNIQVGKSPCGVDSTTISSIDLRRSSFSESPPVSSLSASFNKSNDDFHIGTCHEDLMPISGNQKVKDASMSNPRHSVRVSKPTPSLLQYREDMKLNGCNKWRKTVGVIGDEETRDIRGSQSLCCSERECMPAKNSLQLRKTLQNMTKINKLIPGSKEIEDDQRCGNRIHKRHDCVRKKHIHKTKKFSIIIKKMDVKKNEIKPTMKKGIKEMYEEMEKNKSLNDQAISRCSGRISKPTKSILQFRETLKRKRKIGNMCPSSKMHNGKGPAKHVQEQDIHGKKALAFEIRLCSVNIKKVYVSTLDIQAATKDYEGKEDKRNSWKDNQSQNKSAFEEELRKRFTFGEEN